jgi:hypothetical protein
MDSNVLKDNFGSSSGSNVPEGMEVIGRYKFECFDADGNLKWVEEFDNLVTTLGKNQLLDVGWGGTTYAAMYMGLISSVSYTTGPVVGDTLASHAGWTEAGLANAPTYSGNRATLAWNAASAGSKATTSTSFTFTGSGTVKGSFIVTTNNTKDNTATGILMSAGTFAADKVVVSTDVVNVTYTSTLT